MVETIHGFVGRYPVLCHAPLVVQQFPAQSRTPARHVQSVAGKYVYAVPHAVRTFDASLHGQSKAAKLTDALRLCAVGYDGVRSAYFGIYLESLPYPHHVGYFDYRWHCKQIW